MVFAEVYTCLLKQILLLKIVHVRNSIEVWYVVWTFDPDCFSICVKIRYLNLILVMTVLTFNCLKHSLDKSIFYFYPSGHS